jgi:hypothetical protein
MKNMTLNQKVNGRPTIVKRPAAARRNTELGWLHSRHTFSFGDYFDRDAAGGHSASSSGNIVPIFRRFGSHQIDLAQETGEPLRSVTNDCLLSQAGTVVRLCCCESETDTNEGRRDRGKGPRPRHDQGAAVE